MNLSAFSSPRVKSTKGAGPHQKEVDEVRERLRMGAGGAPRDDDGVRVATLPRQQRDTAKLEVEQHVGVA